MPGARSSELPRTIEKSDPAAPELARGALTEQPPILRAVARTLVRNASEVEDLVQDVFEKALRSIDRIDLDANPRGWMVTILHNLHIDRCRRRARCILAGCAACRAGLHDALQLIALEARATAPAAARDRPPAARSDRPAAARAWAPPPTCCSASRRARRRTSIARRRAWTSPRTARSFC